MGFINPDDKNERSCNGTFYLSLCPSYNIYNSSYIVQSLNIYLNNLFVYWIYKTLFYLLYVFLIFTDSKIIELCVDINECHMFNNLCVFGNCENIFGTFRCECNEGYQLDNTGGK